MWDLLAWPMADVLGLPPSRLMPDSVRALEQPQGRLRESDTTAAGWIRIAGDDVDRGAPVVGW